MMKLETDMKKIMDKQQHTSTDFINAACLQSKGIWGIKIFHWVNNPDVATVVTDYPDGGNPLNFDIITTAFPIYKKDLKSIDIVLNKYAKGCPLALNKFNKKWEAEKAVMNANGWSNDRTKRMFMCLPDGIRALINQFFPDYLKDRKGLKKLQKKIPKYFIGNDFK